MTAPLETRGSRFVFLLVGTLMLLVSCAPSSAASGEALLHPESASDPTCRDGLPNGTVCCARECGRCGGEGCGGLPGGADSCCSSAISKQHKSCDTNPAPCVMDKPAPGSNCTLQSGVLYVGNDVARGLNTSTVAACCALCGETANCSFFSYDTVGKGCYVSRGERWALAAALCPGCGLGRCSRSPTAGASAAGLARLTLDA